MTTFGVKSLVRKQHFYILAASKNSCHEKNIVFTFHFSLFTFFTFCDAQNVMTPEQLWKLGRVSGETLSPDGKWAIYGISYYNVDSNKGEENLYAIALAGGQPKQLTTTVGAENNVQFSPSGKMGYVYKGNWYESNSDGSAAVQLTHDNDGIDNVKYSPDGKWVLFSKNVKIDQMKEDLYPNLPKASCPHY